MGKVVIFWDSIVRNPRKAWLAWLACLNIKHERCFPTLENVGMGFGNQEGIRT
jgi:hypothetical protein